MQLPNFLSDHFVVKLTASELAPSEDRSFSQMQNSLKSIRAEHHVASGMKQMVHLVKAKIISEVHLIIDHFFFVFTYENLLSLKLEMFLFYFEMYFDFPSFLFF